MNKASIALAGANDRISFALFVALILHVGIVLTGIEREDPPPPSRTMEITLAQYDDLDEVEKADFLAQTNQLGSGEAQEKAQLSTSEHGIVPDDRIRETGQPEPLSAAPTEQVQGRTVITTTAPSKNASPAVFDETPKTEQPKRKRTLLQRSLEIATLEAKLEKQQRAYAKRPRVERLTAASTMRTSDAYYMKAWLEKVEKIGNLNYPEESRRRNIYGSLRLMVALYADGTVKDIKILQSSGHRILDDAAIRIVRLAAPFAPFPEDVRNERDVLEIIRTWSFQKKGLSSY
ncbi:MAG: energy transducer TonB [Pseudomonadales bacterium]|nr:energy transducer TonB [Pseudomonadales bacterium]